MFLAVVLKIALGLMEIAAVTALLQFSFTNIINHHVTFSACGAFVLFVLWLLLKANTMANNNKGDDSK